MTARFFATSLNSSPLNAVAYLKKTRPWSEEFPLLDVALTVRPFSNLRSDLAVVSSAHVLLLDLDDLSESETALVRSIRQSTERACIGLTETNAWRGALSLPIAFDGIALASFSAAGIAWAVHSAWLQDQEKRRLRRQIAELEEQIKQDDLTPRAQTTYVGHSQASEADALRLLRTELRKHRRPTIWNLP